MYHFCCWFGPLKRKERPWMTFPQGLSLAEARQLVVEVAAAYAHPTATRQWVLGTVFVSPSDVFGTHAQPAKGLFIVDVTEPAS